MSTTSKTKSKRYRWNQKTAKKRHAALSKERKRDFDSAFVKIRRCGISVRSAAKEFGIDRENLTAFVRAFGNVKSKPGHKLRITKDKRPVTISVMTPNGEIEVEATGEEAHLDQQHKDALNAARKTRKSVLLKPWRGTFITDRKGVRYELLADLDRFFELTPPDEFNPAAVYA